MLETKTIMNRGLPVCNNVVYLPVRNIKPNPYQPRRIFDNGSMRELTESVMQYGVLQPIIVKRIGLSGYELIAGERRLRACREAGIIKIPAIIINAGENDSAMMALIENIQRENLSYMDEAEAYNNLLTNHDISRETLSKKLGKSESAISNKLRLLKLTKRERYLLNEYNLTERHARSLIRISDEEKRMETLLKVCEEGLNVKSTEKLVDRIIFEEDTPQIKKKGKKIRIFKDIRVFTNTIRHAVTSMKESGIEAESSSFENDDYYEYVIKIMKKK